MLLLAIAFAAGIAAGDAELARVAVWQALCVKAAALGALARGPRARAACAAAVAFAAGALLLAERRAAAWWPSAEPRVEAVVEARVAAILERGDQAVVDLSGVRRAVGAGEALPERVRLYVPLAGARRSRARSPATSCARRFGSGRSSRGSIRAPRTPPSG